MATAAALIRPRPGIAVARQPRLAETAPRMDVALFIGIAQRGPINRPVIIDSVSDYAAVFGGDALLARGADGQMLMAALPAAVAAFFANGGRRAHVVRVALTADVAQRWGETPADVAAHIAHPRHFTLPVPTMAGTPLRLRATSPGRWADDLKLSVRADRSGPRPRLWLRVDDGRARTIFGPFGLAPTDPDSLWALVDDDAAHAAPDAPALARPPVLAAMAPEPIDAGALDDLWTLPVAAEPDPADPLGRDGLSRFDARLFLDPMLAGGNPQAYLQALAGGEALPPIGLGCALVCAGDGDVPEPSLIALPDAAQPLWQDVATPPLPRPILPEPVAHGGFAPCGLPAPVLDPIASPRPAGACTLAWRIDATGCDFTLELATRPDFADALVVADGPDTSATIRIEGAGARYLRLIARRGAATSPPALAGVMIAATGWQQAEPGALADAALAARLHAIHAQALALAAGTGDLFALLSLPRGWQASQAAAHADGLRAAFADDGRTAGFGALFHPWPVRTDRRPLPPDGAMAGQLAAMARTQGAWRGNAGQPIAEVVALDPAMTADAHDRLAGAQINALVSSPDGAAASDMFSLSDTADWRFFGARRLVMLLRRHVRRIGQTLLFEPWGDALVRTADRRFSQLLDDLARRGALAGDGLPGWRLMVAAPGSRPDDGQLVVEIGIAPTSPLRFITVTLARTGGDLAVGGD